MKTHPGGKGFSFAAAAAGSACSIGVGALAADTWLAATVADVVAGVDLCKARGVVGLRRPTGMGLLLMLAADVARKGLVALTASFLAVVKSAIPDTPVTE